MKSIRSRLNFIYGFLILSIFALLAALLLIPLENYFIKQAQEELVPQIKISSALIQPYLKENNLPLLRKVIADNTQQNELRITVIASDGTVLADSESDYRIMDNHLNRPEIQAAAKSGIGYSIRKSATLNEKMLYYAIANKEKGKITNYVRVAESISHIDDIHKRLRNILLSVIAGAAALALAAGFFTARSITNPISILKKSAEEIAHGEFTSRVYLDTEDELADLADSLNIMAEKLALYVASISAEKEQLHVIFEHLSAGVIVTTPLGEILLINSTAEKLFNLPQINFQGQVLQKLIRDEGFNEKFNTALQKNSANEYEIKYREKYLRLHFVPLRNNTLEKKVVVLIYDTTPIKQWQQVRTDFVANASHELRTPLTAIKGYTETLLDGALEDMPTARSFLQIIERESERLTRIVDDLLDLSRLERKTSLNKEYFNLKTLINSVAANFVNPIHEKQLKFENKVSEDLEVFADYDWFEQVFVNLIDNAVKYSKQGGIIIVNAITNTGEVKITVTDTGIGIPFQDLPRIFERFYRVDKSRSRSLGGTGLGLSIVKHIIENHGGNVEAQSSLGEGTTITITLPQKQQV